MRADSDELQRALVRLAVDDDQIRLEMAISESLQVAGERVVLVLHRKLRVGREKGNEVQKKLGDVSVIGRSDHLAVFPLEGSGSPNRPHEDPP